MAHLLVVEDDDVIGRALMAGLAALGHEVDRVATGADAVERAAAGDLALVLLDLGLPDRDGVGVCREIRDLSPSSVIVVLTARDDEMDVIIGLEAGADDYLTKPVRLAELQARVRAHLRRAETAPLPAGPAAGDRVVLGDLEIDRDRHEVVLGGRPLPLRIKEYDLLVRLAADAGRAVTRETLLADVWDPHWFGSTKTLDVHVAGLRRALARDDLCVPVITTLRGHGYRLDPPGTGPAE
ncbi:response regulator transcription factor [Pseudonocardia phyllosphaerae]|uniref:response regulator transcription factor n=1 Tax=Pseudonocardia phyllosphaerae TaxID=3390502 RepID=UPI00397D485A